MTDKIILENWGDDSYMIIARGHHELPLFESKVREEYEHWGDFFECAYHTYFKATPTREGTYYHPSSPGVKGAFKATVATEGWCKRFGTQTWDRERFRKDDIIVNKSNPKEVLKVLCYSVSQGEEFHALNITKSKKLNRLSFDYKLDESLFRLAEEGEKIYYEV